MAENRHGMAGRGSIAGVLYDYFGFYTPAFAAALGINLLNLMIVRTPAFRRGQIVMA